MDKIVFTCTANAQILYRNCTKILYSSVKNYAAVHFLYSEHWEKVNPIALFKSGTKSLSSEVINGNVGIPWEMTENEGAFSLSLYGGDLLTTNEVNFDVEKSGYQPNAGSPSPPTPEIVTTVLDKANLALNKANDTQNTARLAAQTASAQAAIATDKANSANVSKDRTDSNLVLTNTSAAEARQMALLASDDRTAAELAAQIAQSAASSFPMRYYRDCVTAMESIPNAKQGDICYVTNYTTQQTTLYTYDTTDIDSDKINPEWVMFGSLKFSDLSKTDLLNVLNLANVAISGSYIDLLNKPNRYESFLTITNGIWDYSLSDKIILNTSNLVSITNVTNGSIGLINTVLELTLPINSKKSYDYDYLIISGGEHYLYTFIYDGTNYYWTRTVCI